MKKILLLALLPAFIWAASEETSGIAGPAGPASTSYKAVDDVEPEFRIKLGQCDLNPEFFKPSFFESVEALMRKKAQEEGRKLTKEQELMAREAYLSILCPFAFRALPPEARTLHFPQGMYAVLNAKSPYDYLVTGQLHGCTALVLHNPDKGCEGCVGFAHIDHVSRLESLDPLLRNIGFSKTPEGYKGPAKSKVTVFQYTSTERTATERFKKAFDATCALFHKEQDIRITTSNILSHRLGFSGTQITFFSGFPMAEESFAVDKKGNMYNTCLMQGDVLKMRDGGLSFDAFRETCQMNINQVRHLRFGPDGLLINLIDRTSTKYNDWESLPESWKNLFLRGMEQQMALRANGMRKMALRASGMRTGGADSLDLLLTTRSWDFPFMTTL